VSILCYRTRSSARHRRTPDAIKWGSIARACIHDPYNLDECIQLHWVAHSEFATS